MLLRKIDLQDVGPISKLTIDATPLQDGTERVILLVGANGSGKSIAISCIADALIEAKRKFYPDLPDTKKDELYKMISKRLIKRGASFSLAKVEFTDLEYRPVFTEFASQATTFPEFQTANPNADNVIQQYFVNDMKGLYKDIGGLGSENPFIREVLLYFPVQRFSLPFWLNADTGFRISPPDDIINRTSEYTVVENAREKLENWIIETVLDEKLMETQLVNLPISGSLIPISLLIGGRNTNTSRLIIEFIKCIFETKFGDITSVQIQVGPKFNRTLSFQFETSTGAHTVRGLSEMSSGEVEALYLIGMILRYADRVLSTTSTTDPTSVSGLVIVDEIEKHHHISLQQKLIPKLIKLFPRIGFVISTQSPFVPIALQESLGDRLSIIDLPIGRGIGPDEFSEFKDVLSLMVKRFEQGKRDVSFLTKQRSESEKPRIYFEGKTDSKHVLSAIDALGGYEGIETADIVFVQSEEDRGDGRLLKMCENAARLETTVPSVFIFDRDVSSIIRAVEDQGQPKKWSDNVISFAIPVPSHRIGYEYISIEMLYSDNDLLLTDPQSGKRLIFSNEITWTFEAGLQGKGKKTPTGGVIREPNEALEMKKYIEDHDVVSLRTPDGRDIGHSKSRFAELVASRATPFDQVGFSGFIPLLERLKMALDMIR